MNRSRAFNRESNRHGDCSGDQHHARNRSRAEYHKIGQRPNGLVNNRQDEKRERGGAGQSMDDTDDERAQNLKKGEPTKPGIKRPGVIRHIGFAEFLLRTCCLRAIAESVLQPFKQSAQIKHAERDQHQRDGKLERQAGPPRDDDAKPQDHPARQHDCYGVADPPKRANQRRAADAVLAADHGGNSHDVVRIRGVSHSKEQAKQYN